MTPEELKEARLALGLSMTAMAAMLGYEGAHAKIQIYRMETGERPIREAQRRLVVAYLEGYRPKDWPDEGN